MTNLLREADPARTFELPGALDDRAMADLSAILGDGGVGPRPAGATGPATRRRRGRRGLVAAAVAAFLVVGAVAVGVVTRPAPVEAAPVALPVLQVAQPSSGTAAAALTALAAMAARATPAAGDPATQRYRAWSFNARIEGRTTNTAIVATDNAVTRAVEAGGAELLTRRVTVASIDYPTPQSRAAWEQDTPVRVGDAVDAGPPAAGLFTGPVPHDPVALRAFLAQGHPVDAYGPGELFVAVTDLAQERRLTGQDTATTLRALAAEPGITALGRVQDRSGRPGIAFAADGDFTGLPTRYVLVFDPATGRLLASETWLTQSAGSLGIRVPAATDYRLFGVG